MNYLLHPEAEFDLRDAAEYYQEQAGVTLAQVFFAEFTYTMNLLMQHPLLGSSWLHNKRRLVECLMLNSPLNIKHSKFKIQNLRFS